MPILYHVQAAINTAFFTRERLRKKESETKYLNGKEDGWKRRWDFSGKLVFSAHIIKGSKLDGEFYLAQDGIQYFDFYKNGVKRRSIQYWGKGEMRPNEAFNQTGDFDGIREIYRSDGSLEFSEEYRDGKFVTHETKNIK